MNKASRQSLAERTADALLQYIQSGNFPVGGKLPGELELLEIMEVGRNTLREAIRILADKNILEVRRGSGTYISSKMGIVEDPLGLGLAYDKEKMAKDLILVRILIEPKMAALAAQNASAREKERLLELCGEMEEALLQNQANLFKDLEFHAAIATASRNTVIHSIVPSIHQALLLQYNLPRTLLGKKSLQDHRQIARAISAGKASDAYDAMEMHLLQNKQRIYNN